MRIVHALGWYFPESLGGTEVYVAGLCQRLKSMSHEVSVVAPDSSHSVEREYEHEGIQVYRYPTPLQPTKDECQGRIHVRGTEFLHSWLKRKAPDIFHIHSFVTGLGIPEMQAAKACGARIIATNHLGLGFLCQRGSLMRWGESLCDGICQPAKCAACALQDHGMPKSLALAVGSIPGRVSHLANKLPGRFGTMAGMSDLIANNLVQQRDMLAAVDNFVLLNQWGLNAVVANGGLASKLRLNRLGMSQQNVIRKPGPEIRPTSLPIKIGYVGRIVSIKGVYDLARAVLSLPKKVAIQIEIRGLVNNSESRHTMQELKAMLNEERRAVFAAPVPASEVPNVMTGYDVLCCPSTWFENGPTVANEAHAVGTPVIGTRIGGLAELVTDGVNGRLVEPGDWRALAAVFREMADDPTGTVDQWRNALPTARTMDEIAQDYLLLYQA